MSKLYIAMYHYVRDLKNSRYPDIKGLDISLFKQQIAFAEMAFKLFVYIFTKSGSLII